MPTGITARKSIRLRPIPEDHARALSGGNQQKVILARELDDHPEMVIANQPTRGLDIGASEYVDRNLDARNDGAAVLLVSADLEEILQLSDRIAVIYDGKIMGIPSGRRRYKYDRYADDGTQTGGKGMNSKIINSIKQFVIAVLTIVLALAVGAILVRISGNDPAEAYTILFRGALGSKARISEVLVKMIPLTLMALGMSIAYKAQLWNIGANGQLTIGAILATSSRYLSGTSDSDFTSTVPDFVSLSAVLSGAVWRPG